MAITTADQFFNAARQSLLIRKGNVGGAGGVPFSMWSHGGIPAAGTLPVGNTTSGVLFDNTFAGAPAIVPFGIGNTGYVASARARTTLAGGYFLYDRLWGAGAVSLTSLGTTTFSSQPSYADRLPGGNDYASVDLYIELTNIVSATATTVSVEYTNENGVTGRVTDATPSLSGLAARRLLQMNLQAGDKGVQKIDSVTVGGVVATSGEFNVIVARRIAMFDIRINNTVDAQAWDMLGIPQIWDSSCLWVTNISGTNQSGAFSLQLDVVNG